MSKTKKIISTVFTALSYVLIAVAVVVFALVVIARAKREIPSVLGYSMHIVVTNSMERDDAESIDVGTLVVVKKCDLEDVKEQDIILFEPDPKPTASTSSGLIQVDKVLHRVISIDPVTGAILETKGDNNASADTFSVKTLYGKMIGKSKTLGNALVFLTEKGSLNFLFLAFIVILGGMIISIVAKMVNTVRHAGEEPVTESPEETERRVREEVMRKLIAEKLALEMKQNSAENSPRQDRQAADESDTTASDDR